MSERYVELIPDNGASCHGCGEPAVYSLGAGLQSNVIWRTRLCKRCWNQLVYDESYYRKQLEKTGAKS